MDPVLPDVEALLCTALRVHPALLALHGGRVGVRLYGSFPAVRVAATGGPQQPVTATGTPTLQVECWADDRREQATDLARTVVAACPDLPSYAPGLLAVTPTGEPFPAPDQTTGRERFIVQVVCVVQPVST